MSAIGVGTCDFALLDSEFGGELGLQTGGIKSGKSSDLRRFQP